MGRTATPLDYLPPERTGFPRRWWIAVLLTAAVTISYVDRQALPVARNVISQQIPISNTQFGYLNNAFLLAYAAMYVGGGKLIDAFGVRRGYVGIMIFWSLACAGHGLATGLWFLAGCRFLLGIGEGGTMPAATKAVAEWFPPRERSAAMGLVIVGTSLGAVVAPPAIAWIISVSNWRWVFFAAGAVGLAWAAWWLWEYHPPAEHPRVRPAEREMIAADHAAFESGPEPAEPTPWAAMLAYPQTWGLVVAKFLSDAAWFLYAFWLPPYLANVHQFDIKKVGYFAWIPYAASGFGCVVGGGLASLLVRRGRSMNFSRKLALGLSAALMPSVILVTLVPVQWAIVIFCVVFFGHQAWSPNLMTLPTDLFPRRMVGSVAGLIGGAGALGGVVLQQFAGFTIDRFKALGDEAGGYRVVFAVSGTLRALAFGVVLVMIPAVGMLVRGRPVPAEVVGEGFPQRPGY